MKTLFSSLKWRLAQWAEYRWWRWYLRSKSPEVYLKNKAAYWQRFLKQCEVSPTEDEKVLDAGCGPAGVFIIFNKQATVAVDPLLNHYESLPHFSRSQYPLVQFVAEPLEKFHTNKIFDWVFCLNALNHTLDPQLSLQNIRKTMAPGSRLVLATDAHKYPLLCHLFQWLPGDFLHPQQYLKEDYQNMLLAEGLKVQRVFDAKKGLVFDYTVFVAAAEV